jgi:Zn-finger nucleic acid-binding protein
MNCPRDNTPLAIETHRGIEVDHCPTCNGRWLDHHELDQLEATTASTEAERRATIAFGERPGELDCPKCGKRMKTFQYRAYDLELDACPDEHGFWLDAGEDGRVRDIIAERVRDLARSADAEVAWGRFLGGLKRGGKGLFGGRR